jgi:hypothetical protein
MKRLGRFAHVIVGEEVAQAGESDTEAWTIAEGARHRILHPAGPYLHRHLVKQFAGGGRFLG